MAFENAWKYLTEYSSVRTIPLDNSLVHQGKGFMYKGKSLLATATIAKFLLVTPADIDIHFRAWSIKSTVGPLDIAVYEAATTSALGTLVSAINTNRQTTILPKMLLYASPTVVTNGTLLIEEYIGGVTGGAPVIAGEEVVNNVEWFLKRNTKYLITLNNTSGTTATIITSLSWFET